MRRDSDVRDTVAPATRMGAMTTTREEREGVIDATTQLQLQMKQLLGGRILTPLPLRSRHWEELAAPPPLRLLASSCA